jgi:hypothetical protein
MPNNKKKKTESVRYLPAAHPDQTHVVGNGYTIYNQDMPIPGKKGSIQQGPPVSAMPYKDYMQRVETHKAKYYNKERGTPSSTTRRIIK